VIVNSKDDFYTRLKTKEELIYCHAVARVMMLATIKNSQSLVRTLYASVLDLYDFEGVYTLFYVLATTQSLIPQQQVVPPGPDAPAGDHLGYQLAQHFLAGDFNGGWGLFERDYVNAEPSTEIHVGTLGYLINVIGCGVVATAAQTIQGLAEED
jgi:hypothetical protein